ncbi:hypothetical protein BDA99DRAFT_531095 [Phascolomyces articulosus]|uniref:Uncharacterized protein n=1 Tax=Phascolomyces articulosus TaxID=60185 RepID=A0AAD5KBN3_9FUNG|nr:hypothetical protein BDA99DRAFT_531095 [Phascolomyces articulosus]
MPRTRHNITQYISTMFKIARFSNFGSLTISDNEMLTSTLLGSLKSISHRSPHLRYEVMICLDKDLIMVSLKDHCPNLEVISMCLVGFYPNTGRILIQATPMNHSSYTYPHPAAIPLKINEKNDDSNDDESYGRLRFLAQRSYFTRKLTLSIGKKSVNTLEAFLLQ